MSGKRAAAFETSADTDGAPVFLITPGAMRKVPAYGILTQSGLLRKQLVAPLIKRWCVCVCPLRSKPLHQNVAFPEAQRGINIPCLIFMLKFIPGFCLYFSRSGCSADGYSSAVDPLLHPPMFRCVFSAICLCNEPKALFFFFFPGTGKW